MAGEADFPAPDRRVAAREFAPALLEAMRTRLATTMTISSQPRLALRVGRQLLTVFLALITLAFGVLLTWASLAPPRASELPRLTGDSGPVNDLPADLTWLLLIGIAIVAWRQIGVGLITAVGCATMVLVLTLIEADRFSQMDQVGGPFWLIYLVALIQAGSFLAVGLSVGLFGWRQRVRLHRANEAEPPRTR